MSEYADIILHDDKNRMNAIYCTYSSFKVIFFFWTSFGLLTQNYNFGVRDISTCGLRASVIVRGRLISGWSELDVGVDRTLRVRSRQRALWWNLLICIVLLF